MKCSLGHPEDNEKPLKNFKQKVTIIFALQKISFVIVWLWYVGDGNGDRDSGSEALHIYWESYGCTLNYDNDKGDEEEGTN